MPSTLTARPSAVLTGDHQLVPPLPVDGTTYLPPRLMGWDGYGYLAGDGNAAALISDLLELPNIGTTLTEPEVVGETKLAYTGSSGTSWNVPVPTTVGGDTSASRVKAGDLAVVDCISQESVDVAVPATPATWQTRGSWGSATGFIPRVTRFFKMMSGGETGTLVTVATASARFHFSVRIIRGVDISSYFAAAAAASLTGQSGSVNPPSLTTTADGALVEVFVAANVFPNGADDYGQAMAPAGFDLVQNYLPDERGAASHTKIRTTAGAEDAGALGRTFDNWTIVVDAYRPATNSGLTLLVASLVSDPTATAVPGTTPSLAHNEKQTVTSVLPSGTFTLSWNGQTTAAINWNDSAATIQTRLRDLSNIGATDVVCTGGPLPTNPVVVEFQSALANQDVALITASSGSVTITETQKGHPTVTFAWEGSVNCPRWLDGPAWENGSAPQINFWSATPSSYVAGTKLSVTASDHGANNTVSALLLVIADALVSNPISDTFGSAVGLLAQTQATFGAITPTLAGSRILAILGLSTAALYTADPNPTVPARMARAAQIQSDRSVLDMFISPPVPATADTPRPVQWTGSQDFVTGLMALQPAGSAGSLTLDEVLGDDATQTYAEITAALGSLYEVVEVDLSAVPANGVITGASLEIEHAADGQSYLRAVLVGIDAGGEIFPCAELRSGGYPTAATGNVQTVTTGTWVETADGTSLTEFDRLGIALFSTTRNPAVTSHKVYKAVVVVEYEPGGPVVSGVVGPGTAGDAAVWEYSSDAGLAQTHVQVRIRHGATQLEGVVADSYPTNPLSPATGNILYDSGKLPGSLRRTLEITDVPLSRGSMTISVRAWARLASGREIVSDWATANFDITGSPATAGTQSTQPAFNAATGAVSVTVVAPAAVSRAWLARSTDSGTTWEIGGPFTVTPSATNVLADFEAPLAEPTLRYQVSFDAGPMTETSAPVAVGSGDISTAISSWYLLAPNAPALSIPIDVADFDTERPRSVVISDGPEETVVMVGPDLGRRIQIVLRAKTAAERAALDAILSSGEELRLVSILGRAWWVKPGSGIREKMLKWMALPTETTTLRDAHTMALTLVQTRRS